MPSKRVFKNVAHFLRTERESIGLSQGELASILGWNNGQCVSNIERAKCSIPLAAIPDMAKALRCPVVSIKRVIELDFKQTLNEYAPGR